MSFPKGAIWQEFRALALDAIPETSQVSYRHPSGLIAWRDAGYFTVSGMTSSEFTLIAAPDDLGSALLGDVEFLLDHAAEHQASVWAILNAGRWFSPAWLAVTFYYWAFFSTLAISRLLGRSIWYLDPTACAGLRRLAPPIPRPPGAGAYKLTCSTRLSETSRELLLRKSTGRMHDGLWQVWFEICAEYATKHNALRGNSLEDRVFSSIVRTGRHLKHDWPSTIRNLVNYRPGFGYDFIRRVGAIGSFTFIRTDDAEDVERIVNRFENSAAGASAGNAMEQAPRTVVQLLVDLAFLVHVAATDLYQEIAERRSLDRRRQNLRQRFLTECGMQCERGIWPCSRA
jgi:hypothetical protein